MKTCPIRALTGEVESALRWFFWTHAIVLVPMVGAIYQRQCWPTAGGAGEQDAWLTQALDYLCDVHNAMMREASKRREAKPKKRDRNGQ